MDDNRPKGSDGPQVGDTPGIRGSVVVVLTEEGKVGIQTTGGISKLTAVGLLEAGKQIIVATAPKVKSRIIPGTGIPDSALRKGPPQGE